MSQSQVEMENYSVAYLGSFEAPSFPLMVGPHMHLMDAPDVSLVPRPPSTLPDVWERD